MAIDTTAQIHPTAIIEDGAEIGAGSASGPTASSVPGSRSARTSCSRATSPSPAGPRVGEATRIFPFASIGHIPQDLKFHGEEVELVIGARNSIREHSTMNPGTGAAAASPASATATSS